MPKPPLWARLRARTRTLVQLGLLALVAHNAHGAAGALMPSRWCDQSETLSAAQQDKMLRFAAVVREELAAGGRSAALVSRSGLDLLRFNIRYSHAAVALPGEAEAGASGSAGEWQNTNKAATPASAGSWSARQLYYACDEGRPRLYDQGLAGFVMGIANPGLAYISIVRFPPEAAQQLQAAASDKQRALALLGERYSANAFAFSQRYQNCNQWVMELLALAWGALPDGPGLRGRAQDWLAQAGYAPAPVDVGSHALMFAATFVPLLHLDDHPEADRFALKLKLSLPSTIEAFVQQRLPGSERVELCHNGSQVVVHRGWTPVAEGCQPAEGDRVLPLD